MVCFVLTRAGMCCQGTPIGSFRTLPHKTQLSQRKHRCCRDGRGQTNWFRKKSVARSATCCLTFSSWGNALGADRRRRGETALCIAPLMWAKETICFCRTFLNSWWKFISFTANVLRYVNYYVDNFWVAVHLLRWSIFPDRNRWHRWSVMTVRPLYSQLSLMLPSLETFHFSEENQSDQSFIKA